MLTFCSTLHQLMQTFEIILATSIAVCSLIFHRIRKASAVSGVQLVKTRIVSAQKNEAWLPVRKVLVHGFFPVSSNLSLSLQNSY